ncbi:hypothetical protein NL676_006588 [Syzygium grande]|nr:hypothetical protein NL676_006588 [Syzygium grande]
MEAGAATNGASTSADDETNRGSREEEEGPSLNSLALMRKVTTPANISSVDIKDWCRVIYEGVLLKKNAQAKSHYPLNSIYLSYQYQLQDKFWVDEKLHKNCFLVLPKACDIAGGDEESCWSWITEKENCFRSAVDIPVPESKQLSWLLIQGRFKTRALSPNTTYEVAFVVKVNGPDSSSISNVTLELDLPDGTKQTGTEDLERKPKKKWIKLCASEFMMGPKTVGTIIFALQQPFKVRMSGLILRGVLIHPKDDSAKHNQDDAVEHEFL